MTRRALASLALVASAVVLAACGGATKNAGAGGLPGHGAEAFPPGVLAFVDVDANVDSAGWQKVRTLLARFPSWPKAEAALTSKLAVTSSDGVSFNADVKPWLGDEAAAAVYGIAVAAGKPEAVAYVASKDDAKAAAFLTGPGKAHQSGSYKGYDEYAMAKGDGVAAIGKGALLLGTDSASLHRSIDAREGGERLADAPTYKATVARLPGGSVALGYVDGPKLASLLDLAMAASGQAAAAAGISADQMKTMLGQYDALQAIGFSVGAADAGFQVKAVTLGDLPGNGTGTATLLASAPANSLLFADVAGFGASFKQMMGVYDGIPQVSSTFDQIKATTGIDARADLTALLSGELAVSVADGAPVKGELLLKPTDPAAAAAALEEIVTGLGKAGLPPAQPLPDGGEGGMIDVQGAQVAWRHDGDLVSIGMQTGGAKPAGGLADSAAFQRVAGAAGMSGDQAMLLYADVPGLMAWAQRQQQTPSTASDAEALANVKALGGLLAFGKGGDSTLFLEVPPPSG